MDKILRALMCGNEVSLTVLETTKLVDEAVKIHGLQPAAAKILGGLLTCCAYLASSLKDDGASVSITVKAKDGDGAVSVSADKDLHIRGYADGSCTKSLAGGTLTVVREDGRSLPFVGTCEITSDKISDVLETYFGQSEQIATAASIDVEFAQNGECLSAGGVIMQLLPDASENSILEAGNVFNRFNDRAAISQTPKKIIDADKIVSEYFKPYISGEITALFPEYKCNCSEEKIRGVLASVGKTELLKICEELGEVKVHCHYCNKDYIYDRKRIEETFQ